MVAHSPERKAGEESIMTALDIFTYSGQQVRTVVINGEPWFVAADVTTILGYKNGRAAVAQHTLEFHRGVSRFTTPSGGQDFSILSERGIYRLIMRSNVPDALDFQEWLADKVLPAIRKTGTYSNTPALTEDETILRALTILTGRTAELEAKVEADAPKVLFADAVATSATTILVGDLAKILRGNGINIGANRLFERLRDEGFLIRRQGTDRNMPTQRAMDLGLFKVKETAVTHSDGHVTVSKTPKVTGKGQTYFVNRYTVGENLAVA